MDHIIMGMIWDNLWAIYGLHMVLIWDITHHIIPIWCHALPLYCLIYGKDKYIVKNLYHSHVWEWYGMIAMQRNDMGMVWEVQSGPYLPYENLWPEWARFRPDLGHKAVFKARTERDKARQPFCRACAIEPDISLVCLSPIMWREWARKIENPFYNLRRCNKTFVRLYYRWNSGCSLVIRYISEPHLLFNQRRSVETDLGVPLKAIYPLKNVTLTVVLLHYICCISVSVVCHCGWKVSKPFSGLKFWTKIQLWLHIFSEWFLYKAWYPLVFGKVKFTIAWHVREKQSGYLRTALTCLSNTEDNNWNVFLTIGFAFHWTENQRAMFAFCLTDN